MINEHHTGALCMQAFDQYYRPCWRKITRTRKNLYAGNPLASRRNPAASRRKNCHDRLHLARPSRLGFCCVAVAGGKSLANNVNPAPQIASASKQAHDVDSLAPGRRPATIPLGRQAFSISCDQPVGPLPCRNRTHRSIGAWHGRGPETVGVGRPKHRYPTLCWVFLEQTAGVASDLPRNG